MNKTFEIITGKGSIFSKIFEIIQSYIEEINIVINEDGFFISSYDNAKNSLTKIDLYKDKFELFTCNSPITIGINTKILYKTIKSISKKDTITFYINKNELNKLNIILSDPSGSVKEYKIPLLMIESSYQTFPPKFFENYEHIINLPASKFKSIIKDFDLLDVTTIEIKSFNKQISFSGINGDADPNFTLKELDENQKKKITDILQGEDIKCIRYDKYNESIIQGKFNLRKLKILIKATNLCDYMNIYLKNDFPIVLEYDCADMGPFKYVLNVIDQKQ